MKRDRCCIVLIAVRLLCNTRRVKTSIFIIVVMVIYSFPMQPPLVYKITPRGTAIALQPLLIIQVCKN
ncbi:hypothetical protein [Brunnivagina elsteri]|uniref:hypothetical protein n=1 Tax=Brunnivagina elsteri TaxID=1247191 RepID=UPI001178B5E4|nr:hypothetical protein [Calothrix elsteri]